MTITFDQFLQEQKITENLEKSGLDQQLLQSADWSDELTVDELFKALEIDSDI